MNLERNITGILAALVAGFCIGTGLAGDLRVDNLTVNSDTTVYGRLTVGHPSGTAPTNGLNVYYSFDSDDGTNVWDSSGNGNHGRVVGGVTYTSGHYGQSPRFTSSSTYIVSTNAGLNQGGWTSLTVSVWAKCLASTTYGTLVARGGSTNSSQASGTWLQMPGHVSYPGVRGYIYTNQTANTMVSYTPKPTLSTWYHLVQTYDGQVNRLYMDSTLVASNYASPSGISIFDTNNTEMVVGNAACTPYITWGDMYFNGQVDDLRIYNRALSSNEVIALYWNNAPETSTTFEPGVKYTKPLGDIPMGIFTNRVE